MDLDVLGVRSMVNQKSELRHYGIKGMRWGIRRKKTTRKNEQIKKKLKSAFDLTSRFCSRHGGELVTGASILAMAAVGAPALGKIGYDLAFVTVNGLADAAYDLGILEPPPPPTVTVEVGKPLIIPTN